ncbi:MAG: DUF2339 domain-containing protein, partial [Acidobacteriota bacterium]|nr:DUF2339 domain-containing protein [Acidobacteriota bacterium]
PPARPPKRPEPAETPWPTRKAAPRPGSRPAEVESTAIPVGYDKSNVEKFVGTYLISIIGIFVTIIGVAIGAKFAIDNDLISPLMRIVFGYTVGVCLCGFAVRLRGKYPTFSAVLLSGGMAIMYFITYFAYSYYSLISQTSAFALMVIFTTFTVLAAINYNRQIIAHIGLVGAYAVPFLLSDDSGRAFVLFTYTAIINLGILAVSVRKYWIPLFYTSFAFTWMIFIAWYDARFVHGDHFLLAIVFATVYFLTFYASFLAYKAVRNKQLSFVNISLVLVNSLVYYGVGYSILDYRSTEDYLGLFTIANAFLHFVVAALIRKFELGDKTSFYLIVALVLTFTAITFPVVIDGNWITVLWMAEATFLFVIGRVKRIPIFEYFSYPLLILAAVSLVNDWMTVNSKWGWEDFADVLPFWNPYFVTSLIVAGGFGVICFVDRNENYKAQVEENVRVLIRYLLPAAFACILYNTFRMEIAGFFSYREFETAVSKAGGPFDYLGTRDEALWLFSVVAQINYSLLFVALLSYLNLKKFRNSFLGFVSLGVSSASVFAFLTIGLFALGGLRWLYISQLGAEYFYRGIFLVLIRYLSLLFVAGAVWAVYQQTRQDYLTKYIPGKIMEVLFDIGLCSTLLTVLSVELITWTDILKIDESSKLGLSILWGIFSLKLIIIGIGMRKKHLRIFAIALFALTVIKLFVYDIAELSTIPKTIVFVAVGVLLLIASFLYNKFTKRIFEEDLR